MVPEAGHAAFWEQSEAWNKLVLDFIGEYEG
jgi:pimeloyl-ACP methyl ester carboxylesterase